MLLLYNFFYPNFIWILLSTKIGYAEDFTAFHNKNLILNFTMLLDVRFVVFFKSKKRYYTETNVKLNHPV